MKFLVIGYSRHGKDTVGDMIAEVHDLTKLSATRIMFKEIIWPAIGKYYDSMKDCFDDKANCRKEWFHLVRAWHERHGEDWLCRRVLGEGSDVYCGVRSRDEFDAVAHLFDLIVWVERPDWPKEDDGMELNSSDADVVIYNDGSLDDLWQKVVEQTSIDQTNILY